MDALKALAGQQGCAADGTTAQRNPLSQFVHQSMGGPQKQQPRGPGGQMAQGPGGRQGMSDIDQGFAQGMGVMQGPRGPAMAGQGMAPSFVQEFEQQMMAQRGGQMPVMHGPRGPAARPMGQEQWVNDFERMRLGGAMPQRNVHMEAAYRNTFRQGAAPRPMGQRWAGQMAARPPPSQMDAAWKKTAAPAPAAQQWAQEVAGPKEAPDAAKWAEEMNKEEQGLEQQQQQGPDTQDMRAAADDLVKAMADNPNFRDSEFFDFISKINTGELEIEGNKVVETGQKAAPSLDSAWNQAKPDMDAAWEGAAAATEKPMDAAWEQSAMGKMENMMQKAWEDTQNGEDVDFESLYRNALSEAGLDEAHLNEAWGTGPEAQMDGAWNAAQATNLADRPYELASENPFVDEDNPYEKGMEFFKADQLKDAILAFEAAVTKDSTHADAWRMLGVSHQENDQDPKAIACLERAVENDAYHLDALLDLGVSYVNELDHEKALSNLKAWVVNNPNFQGLEITEDMYGNGSLMDNVTQLMLKAQEWAPNDPEVQQVLGVLYNVSRDYNSAVLSFQKALESKPDSYSLWNKLGATLANGQRSEEAVPAYHRALEIKPKHPRVWLNLGISHSNLGNYAEAARCYLKAIDLNPSAVHVWGYLRICFTCMERFDLIAAADKRNLEAFRAEFKF
mmetsp:Transcript_22063/g.39109  ORF Transcript_22063/g.39109 Transcript_22063/m.39109 type:complete len:676 (-) Transcript_22063:249-2276(-)